LGLGHGLNDLTITQIQLSSCVGLDPQSSIFEVNGGRPGNAGAQWGIVTEPKMVHSGSHAMRCITRDDADTSLFADVPLKPNTEYKLSAWIKTHAFKGKASLNDHVGRAETSPKIGRSQDWTEVEVVFNSKERAKASINLLHVGKGDVYFR